MRDLEVICSEFEVEFFSFLFLQNILLASINSSLGSLVVIMKGIQLTIIGLKNIYLN